MLVIRRRRSLAREARTRQSKYVFALHHLVAYQVKDLRTTHTHTHSLYNARTQPASFTFWSLFRFVSPTSTKPRAPRDGAKCGAENANEIVEKCKCSNEKLDIRTTKREPQNGV